ncbi:hypothetical protein PI124_g4904 [Phytophthora idaei]|nr:hypothetical protein PI124_g4904 [Phytophthora idaei]
MVIPYFLSVGSTGSMEGDSSCSSASAGIVAADKEVLANHSCVHLGEISLLYDFFTTDSANSVSSYRWYSSNDPDTTISSSNSQSDNASGTLGSNDSSSSGSIATENRSSSISSGALTGIIIAAVTIILAICFSRRRSQAMRADNRFTRTTSPISRDTGSLDVVMSGQRGLWQVEIITAKRIPRDKIKVKKLLSRGAFGEVYSGVFYQRRVAIKMLPSSRRT